MNQKVLFLLRELYPRGEAVHPHCSRLLPSEDGLDGVAIPPATADRRDARAPRMRAWRVKSHILNTPGVGTDFPAILTSCFT